MRTRFQNFDPRTFSFHRDPVLVLEEFWSPDEMAYFREAMSRQKWTALSEMPEVARSFPNCGNWAKAQINAPEASMFLNRVTLPCIADYIESFPNIKQRHLGFCYYSYAAGDCLPMHDDTDQGYGAAPGASLPARRLALATYFHQTWEPDWGGELLIYEPKGSRQGERTLELSHCIMPQPGTLAIFAVPRFHRVARVDTLAGTNRRLSIAGWFMTEHW
ncbi:MAG: 2OG-Fe(II) oxygenase family protein [Nitrospirota bacterium]